jgi:hypothetical protein
MSASVIRHCDRCRQQTDNLPGDVRIHLGGRTLGTNLDHDLCASCTDQLRAWLNGGI